MDIIKTLIELLEAQEQIKIIYEEVSDEELDTKSNYINKYAGTAG